VTVTFNYELPIADSPHLKLININRLRPLIASSNCLHPAISRSK